MRIIFIKSHMFRGRKQVVGQRMTIWGDEGKNLIDQGVAKEYSGSMIKKTKTDFFKPK